MKDSITLNFNAFFSSLSSKFVNNDKDFKLSSLLLLINSNISKQMLLCSVLKLSNELIIFNPRPNKICGALI